MSKEERVIIPSDIGIGATIAYKDKNEKRPLVLLIMGTGSLDRDGNGLGFKSNLYKDLSDMFVDLGYGVLGLLPIGDVSIARFPSIFDVFSVGDDIKVVYKGLYATGYVVTHKELLGTWEENLKEFKMGEYCQGIIRDLKPYGAFIEITPNLTGLAEIPEYMDLDIGDSVCVKLKNTNPEKLKVKLSIVSKSNSEYKLKFKYKITQGVIKEWNYTPFGSMKCIKTEFD